MSVLEMGVMVNIDIPRCKVSFLPPLLYDVNCLFS